MRSPEGSDAVLGTLFRQELSALAQEGKNLAREYPESASFLDPRPVVDPDPYVDRLTEGFAFLAARVRQAVDAQGGGSVDSLLELFDNGLDRILPSVLVVEGVLGEGEIEPAILEKGLALRTSDSRQSHRFTLCEDSRIEPLEVFQARVEEDHPGASHLDLGLRRAAGAAGPWPDTLPIFLHGDAPVVWSLRHALSARVRAIEVRTPDGKWATAEISFSARVGAGYAGDLFAHALSDMRDFLCCDARFRFVEIHGLAPFATTAEIALRIHFEGGYPRSEAKGVSPEVFRPGAVLAVNRFAGSCDGLVWDHTRSEMPLRPSKAGQEIVEILHVESQTRDDPPRRIRYTGSLGQGDDSEGFFQFCRPVAGERLPATIALGRRDCASELEVECVAVEAVCCDGDGPHGRGSVASLVAADPAQAKSVHFRGLTRPTPVFRPLGGELGRERLLALACGHFKGFMDAQRLRDSMGLLLWDPAQAKRPLIDSIQGVDVDFGHRRIQGSMRPEHHVRIHLRDTTCTHDTWDRLGIMETFAKVLASLAAEETPLGARTRLTLVIEPCGIVLESSPR